MVAMTQAKTQGAAAAVLGGETASLLDVPRAPSEGDPFSRAFETRTGGGGYDVIKERAGGGPEGPPGFPLNSFRSYHAQPPASTSPSSSSSLHRHVSPSPERHRGKATTSSSSSSSSSSRTKTKTRFPSLTPAFPPAVPPPPPAPAPAPGAFSANGDTRAAEAVAHARKTWAPPALRTQAIASYGAVPDLEIIPEDTEVNRFQKRQRVRRYTDLGCPECTIS